MKRISLNLIVYLVMFSIGGLAAGSGAAYGFGYQAVLNQARKLSLKPYKPMAKLPARLRPPKLGYSTYKSVRFRPNRRLWIHSGRNFNVMFMPEGLYYDRPIKIYLVDQGHVRALRFHRNWFTYPSARFAAHLPHNYSYAGIELTYPLNRRDPYNIFLVFAGASYLRGVGRGQHFGLSARGIAINTGLPGIEPFPRFSTFWLVRPPKGAHTMVLYALLNGRRVTGAYRFRVQPGDDLRVDVRATLFFRERPRRIGFAPLTSMFFYGRNTARPARDWRPAVHDSAGLAIHNGDGEWLWRPLINPKSVTTSSFSVQDLKGFGLVQRPRDFSAYEDLQTRYDLRPNAWVSPVGTWPRGRVVLVELPESSETEDNIGAFYQPDVDPIPGHPFVLRYRLTFGGDSVGHAPTGFASGTFIGAGLNPGQARSEGACAVRFVVNFTGHELDKLQTGVKANVTDIRSGRISDVHVRKGRPFGGWQLTFLARPRSGKPLDLRAYLTASGHALTDTWTYLLPANMIRPYRPRCKK